MAKKTILVTGANGQLGSELKELTKLFNYNFIFTTKEDLNIADVKLVDTFFYNNKIDICINTAAYTAVDKAEIESELAFKINADGVKNLSLTCQKNNAKLIHISTDFVFDGSSSIPYTEIITTNPLNVYGASKLKGEQFALATDALIIRTSWVYSTFGANFVKTMLNLTKTRNDLSVIFDQIGSPTYAADLANALLHICSNESYLSKKGIYNFSNEGVASWYDFALAIFEIKNIHCKVNPILSLQYPTPAKRQHFSLLNKNKFKTDFNYSIPYWRDSLKICLDKL